MWWNLSERTGGLACIYRLLVYNWLTGLFSYFLSLGSRRILMTQCTCSRMCCRKSTVVWSQDSSTMASEDQLCSLVRLGSKCPSLLSHLASQRFLSPSSFLHCQFLVEQSLAHRLFYLWINLCFPSVLDFGFSLVFYSERVGRRKVCLFVLRHGFAQLRLAWNSLHC